MTYCSHCIAVILTWLRWFAIIVIFVHGGFRMIFLNGEFIIVVIWLNRQCYLVIHPALSSHPQKQALKYQDTMLFPQKWFHCITGGKTVELHRKQIPCGWTIFNLSWKIFSFANTDLRNMKDFVLWVWRLQPRENSSDCLQRDLGYRFY